MYAVSNFQLCPLLMRGTFLATQQPDILLPSGGSDIIVFSAFPGGEKYPLPLVDLVEVKHSPFQAALVHLLLLF